MSVNPFSNGDKSIPKQDSQIVRIDMTQQEIGGRKDHLPAQEKDSRMAVKHVGSGS